MVKKSRFELAADRFYKLPLWVFIYLIIGIVVAILNVGNMPEVGIWLQILNFVAVTLLFPLFIILIIFLGLVISGMIGYIIISLVILGILYYFFRK